MMKTITIITLQNVRNYGSVLQALATQKIFESLGCEVGFFNYLRSNNATLGLGSRIGLIRNLCLLKF